MGEKLGVETELLGQKEIFRYGERKEGWWEKPKNCDGSENSAF